MLKILLILIFISQLSFAQDFSKCNYHKFTWMMIKIYDTYLCSDSVQNITPKNLYQNDFSLIIRYNRSFKQEVLAKQSIKEMKKYYPLQNEERYYNKLLTIFPNIQKRDTIEARYSNGMTKFYHNGNFTGAIQDREFSNMFLDIWLHQKNQYKNMHKELFNL